VGLAYDARHNLLWAAGGPSGQVRAYDADTGALVRTYTVPAPTGFLNDVTVTESGVYVTDSNIQQLVVVPFGPDGSLPDTATTLPITGDFVYGPGFNANGIVNSRGYLLVVQSSTGFLFRVDPATGESVQVDTGGTNLTNGDGMELRGSTLYVVRNRDDLVVRLQVGPDLLTAKPTGELTGATDVPTTATFVAGRLYVVNARFGTDNPTTADYWITRLT
jgi:sugar lactone lactonase YvrE